MTVFRYRRTDPIPRTELVRELSSGVPAKIATALYAATKFDDDWNWVQEQCLTFVKHGSVEVRWAAVTCVGDLAFFRRPLKLETAIPALEKALTDPEIADPAQFSLSVIKQFRGGK
jgi:hypothetical protein